MDYVAQDSSPVSLIEWDFTRSRVVSLRRHNEHVIRSARKAYRRARLRRLLGLGRGR